MASIVSVETQGGCGEKEHFSSNAERGRHKIILFPRGSKRSSLDVNKRSALEKRFFQVLWKGNKKLNVSRVPFQVIWLHHQNSNKKLHRLYSRGESFFTEALVQSIPNPSLFLNGFQFFILSFRNFRESQQLILHPIKPKNSE
jgi:hypothetical protein